MNRNFLQSLIAVALGNLAYWSLWPYLPAVAHRAPNRLDAGLFVDLWFCLVALGILRTVSTWRG